MSSRLIRSSFDLSLSPRSTQFDWIVIFSTTEYPFVSFTLSNFDRIIRFASAGRNKRVSMDVGEGEMMMMYNWRNRFEFRGSEDEQREMIILVCTCLFSRKEGKVDIWVKEESMAFLHAFWNENNNINIESIRKISSSCSNDLQMSDVQIVTHHGLSVQVRQSVQLSEQLIKAGCTWTCECSVKRSFVAEWQRKGQEISQHDAISTWFLFACWCSFHAGEVRIGNRIKTHRSSL